VSRAAIRKPAGARPGAFFDPETKFARRTDRKKRESRDRASSFTSTASL